MLARTASSSNSTAVARSIFVTMATSALLKMVGYFKGLSSPSVTESRTRRRLSPRSYDDGQNLLAVRMSVDDHRSTGAARKSAGGPDREVPRSYDQGTVQISASILRASLSHLEAVRKESTTRRLWRCVSSPIKDTRMTMRRRPHRSKTSHIADVDQQTRIRPDPRPT